MSAIPGDIETDSQPPMTIPLRHFVVAPGFLVGGGAIGALAGIGALPGPATLAHVHLLLAGWVCVTIMGAMTQFVPVWSNVALHSRRLATAQLWLVTAGLVGFAASLLAGRFGWLHVFGSLLLVGFWVFVYNIGRTLAAARPFDVTERYFALALGYFLALTPLGLLLALDYATSVFAGLPVARADVVAAHATLAVFGAVLTTVFGALYQLATMFTQTELHGPDVVLRRFEEVGYPAGVVALAVGRLVGFAPLARVGGEPDSPGFGPMAHVIRHVTGAADERGFAGFGDYGGRARLLEFGAVDGPGRSFLFTRTDTGDAVRVSFDPSAAGVDPDEVDGDGSPEPSGGPMAVLPDLISGALPDERREQFVDRWHDRVGRILRAEPGDGSPFTVVADPPAPD